MLTLIAACVFVIMLAVAWRALLWLAFIVALLWLIGSSSHPAETRRPAQDMTGPAAPSPPPLSEQGQSICFEKARALGWTSEQLARCFRDKRSEERMMRDRR